jgi:hypothetical protein
LIAVSCPRALYFGSHIFVGNFLFPGSTHAKQRGAIKKDAILIGSPHKSGSTAALAG